MLKSSCITSYSLHEERRRVKEIGGFRPSAERMELVLFVHLWKKLIISDVTELRICESIVPEDQSESEILESS